MNKRNLLAQTLKEVVRQKENSESDIKTNIHIIDELKALIPPLSKDELSQLEENILKEGCREPLILWQNEEQYILVDGHNRFSICKKHKIDFNIIFKNFFDIEEVKSWMINNQLGRRNLTIEQQSYLRGKRYETEKSRQGGTGANQYSRVASITTLQDGKDILVEDSKVAKVATLQKTHEKLANEYNVSARTIINDADFAKGLDKIGESNPQLKQDILSGKSKLGKAEVQKLSKLEGEEIGKIKTEEDIILLTQNKKTKLEEAKPSVESMRQALENSGDSILLEIKGSFLIEKGLANYWQKLRKLKKPITADFTDYLTWGQAKAIGLVK